MQTFSNDNWSINLSCRYKLVHVTKSATFVLNFTGNPYFRIGYVPAMFSAASLSFFFFFFLATGRSVMHLWHVAFLFFLNSDDPSTLHSFLQINQLIAVTHSRDQKKCTARSYINIDSSSGCVPSLHPSPRPSLPSPPPSLWNCQHTDLKQVGNYFRNDN